MVCDTLGAISTWFLLADAMTDPLYSMFVNMEWPYIRGRCSITLEEVIDRFKLLLEETSLQNLTALRRSFRTLQTQLERKAVSRVSSVLTRMTDWTTGERNANFKLEVYTKGCRSNQSFVCTKNHEGDNASLCHTVANSATRRIHHAWWIPVLRRQYQKELNFSRLYKPSCLLAHDTLEEEKRDSDPGRPSIHPS